MTHEQFTNEKNYRISLHIAKMMLKKEIITDEDYRVIDTKLKAKYRPIFGGLCR